MGIKKVLVVGMGLMGHGIIQVCAQSGFKTYGYDVSKEGAQKGLSAIEKDFEKRLSKGRITAEFKDGVLGRIQVIDSLEKAKDADLAVEAVFEDLKVKQDVFRKLDATLKPEAILGSNTSGIPATPMASVTKRPDKFVIIHFHQPPTIMKLVEVVRALQTSDDTAKAAMDFCKALDKTPVEIKIDCPGFLTNRTMSALMNEVFYCLYQGVASREDIDLAFKAGFNWPMGPLELADFVGLDTSLHILKDLNERCGGDKYIPCPLLVNMVSAGYLGRKSGKGFYEYK